MASLSLLRVAVCGAGSIGREFALRHLVEDAGVVVVAVIDQNLTLAQALSVDVGMRRAGATVEGPKYRETIATPVAGIDIPTVEFAENLQAVLHLVDAVYIGTPPSTHASLTLTALSAKKHILLEKPISVSNEDADAIVDASERAWEEHKLIVNLNIGMRYNSAVVEMRRRIVDREIGNLLRMRLFLKFIQWPRQWQKQPWVARREQGGPLLEVAPNLQMINRRSFPIYACLVHAGRNALDFRFVRDFGALELQE